MSEQKKIEVDITKTRNCNSCKKDLPENGLYFLVSGTGMRRICHECQYKADKDAGKNPKSVAQNGVERGKWISALSAVPKKESPWISSSSSSSSPLSSYSVSSSSSSTSSSSSIDSGTRQERPSVSSRYKPEPTFQKLPSGEIVLRMKNYFNISETADGNIQVIRKHKAESSPRMHQENAEEELEYGDELEEYDDEEGLLAFSTRDQLYRLIEIFPHVAARLNMTFDTVAEMNDYELESKLELFTTLADLGSNHMIFKSGLLAVANVVEGVSKHPRLKGNFDLTGLTREIAEDVTVDSLLKEVIDQYREEIAENMSPEMKLLSHITLKAVGISFLNKKKREECQQDNNLQR